jgi:hypothetical protein
MKKRNTKFFKAKDVLKYKRIDNELHMAIINQGYIELDKPIHDGYYAEFLLRNDILNRKDSDAIQEALDICKERVWSKNIDFKYQDNKSKKWLILKPKLNSINKEKYETLSLSAKKYFYEDTYNVYKHWKYGFSDKFYRCTLSYELIISITKAYITHRREHNNVLYKMDAENEKMLYIASNYNPWGSYKYKYSKFENKKENKHLALKAKREIMDIKKTYKSSNDRDKLIDL